MRCGPTAWMILVEPALLLAACGATPAPSATSTVMRIGQPTTSAQASPAPTSTPVVVWPAPTPPVPSATATMPVPSVATRVVAHARGETKEPATPHRVVVLDTGALATALDLGVRPVGADRGGGAFAGYLGNRIEGVQEVVGVTGDPNLKTNLRLKPDPIVGTRARNEPIYDRPRLIAATVVAAAHPSQEWKAYAAFVGEALGKPQEARALQGDYDKRIAEPKRMMGDRLATTTASIVRSRPEGVDLYLKKTFAGTVVAEAGLPRPPAQDRAPETYPDNFPLVSIELNPQLGGDVLFWVQRNEQEGAGMKSMMEYPLWSQLGAVKRGWSTRCGSTSGRPAGTSSVPTCCLTTCLSTS